MTGHLLTHVHQIVQASAISLQRNATTYCPRGDVLQGFVYQKKNGRYMPDYHFRCHNSRDYLWNLNDSIVQPLQHQVNVCLTSGSNVVKDMLP